ncbi:hypothetical protein SAMN05444271_11862 [Halohasta litchfieldiae]|jgi:hypothetical protein|uniref:Uncharacterized protein n=1 Tax=Halohasta litchfieldiae TaxID=1073996 RepID=A0A1H6VS32_9EURY|nr:hypothetical protein SAMN05444271_11862 [Halohasta litchfieldiae]
MGLLRQRNQIESESADDANKLFNNIDVLNPNEQTHQPTDGMPAKRSGCSFEPLGLSTTVVSRPLLRTTFEKHESF